MVVSAITRGTLGTTVHGTGTISLDGKGRNAELHD